MSARRGFTLVELLIGMVLFALLMSAAVSFFRSQMRTFEVGGDQTAATQRAQQAVSVLERDLRTAGTNTTAQQPWLVYAGEDVIAFHADHTSQVADPFAVYVDPGAPAGQVLTLPRQSAFALPNTVFVYPDSTYWAAPGVRSPAELLLFFFTPDTSTDRADDYVLYRQVNDAPAELIGRHLLKADTATFFQYFQLGQGEDEQPELIPVARANLPLRHAVPLHLSPADTGVLARIDSVRAVRFVFAATNGREGDAERVAVRTRFVWFRNGALAQGRSCGSRPLFDASVTATPVVIDGAPAVRLAWGPATDETGGEEDVIRYVVWRTAPGQPVSEPLLSIPAGSDSYEYVDTAVESGESWVYSVAAQDCTPQLSSTFGATVIVP